jgi:O-antigen/teichoic acid export membrane protein
MSAQVRQRFLFTVVANLSRSALSFSAGLLLARWLGPDGFGQMAFLLGTFLAARQLLDMGSATAFYTFMSQRQRSRRFVDRYLTWLALQLLLPMVVIGLLMPDGWISAIWHGSGRISVLLALLAVFMQNSLWPAIQQAGESQRRTQWVQGVGVVISLLHLLAVVALYRLGMLGLILVFAVIAVEYLVAAILVRATLHFAPEPLPGDHSERGLFGKYLRYCLPFIPYTWVGFAYEFADRWLLQNFGGNRQQAYYAVSAQFANVALLATASILSIFWKEVAEAHHRGDHERTGMLYRRVSRLMFFIGAACAGFLVPWSEQLLRLLLGSDYTQGALTLALMLVYPVHQSMGQIGDTMLYATERVRMQVGIGMAFMLASIVITYLLLAPRIGPFEGLQLGSEGVAAKMLVLQFLRVNVVMFIICRIWGWKFEWLYQPGILFVCVGLGWLAHLGATSLAANDWHVLVTISISAAFYLVALGLFTLAVPSMTGLSRADLGSEIRAVLRHLPGRPQ